MRPSSIASPAPALAASHWTMRERVLWSALAIALSASWFDLARHWWEEPWARPAALFLPLFVAAAAHDRGRQEARWDGALLVAAGLGWSLLAMGGGLPRLGRPGVPLAMFGLARALGRPSLAVSLLALWVIPPPFALVKALSPGLETGLAWSAATIAEARGSQTLLTPWFLEVGGARLPLGPADGGLPLAAYLAGLGWWAGGWTGGGIREAARRAVRMLPLGFVAQALGLTLAFALLLAGAPEPARVLLDQLPWPVLALALFALRPQRAAAS